MQPIVPLPPSPVPSPAAVPLPPTVLAPEAASSQLPAAAIAPMPGQAAAGGAPGLAQLERAGVPLVLAAEAAGQLRARRRFLYAAAGDMRVADVSALLAEYKARPTLFLAGGCTHAPEAACICCYRAASCCRHWLHQLQQPRRCSSYI